MSRPPLLALGLAGSIVLTSSACFAQDAFSIIALPDTQNYVNNTLNAPLFTQQTQWIADQILLDGNPRNIRFVTHLGDVVSTGTNLTQWSNANASMSMLETGPDGVVPYGILPGNHDYASTGNKNTGTDNYVANFGPARFAGRAWYGGSDPSGNNSYQLFTGDGIEYLHLALEWQPSINVTNGPPRDPSPVAWAQSIISAHPGVPVIISTHEHIDDDPPGRSSSGQALWNELIRINDQVIMVLNGHFHSVGGANDGEYHQVSQNDFGHDVLEVLQDYQDYPNGGDGWLRIITLDPAANEVRFETYSPVLDTFQTETVAEVGPFASEFALALNFVDRFDFADPPTPPQPIASQLVFLNDVDGYTGTSDKEIRSAGGDATIGEATTVTVDGDGAAVGIDPTQALIRFDDVLGTQPGLIDPDAVIASAALSLNVVNAGSGFNAYLMTTDWDETTTWSDLGGDGVTPGIDSGTAALVSIGENDGGDNVAVGAVVLDVTHAVRAWQSGTANLGLGFVPFPAGSNGLGFTSSESTAPPALIVRTLLPGLALADFTQDVDGYNGAVDTQIREADPGTSYATATSFSLDASDPSDQQNHVLIRFDDVFEAGAIPLDKTIVRAWIAVSASDAGDGGSVHRLLQPFDDTDTWASSFGGDGVQADDVEAVAQPESFVVGANGLVEIDVTTSLQLWQRDPTANLGWVLLPSGSNGWDFTSSEGLTGARPSLVVVYDDAPCPEDFDNDDVVGDADLLDVLIAWGRCTCPQDLDGDGIAGFNDILAVLAAWGPCA